MRSTCCLTILALAAAILAVLAKPAAIVLPALLALINCYRGCAKGWRSWLLLLPFAAIAILASGLALRTDAGAALHWQGRLVFAAYLPEQQRSGQRLFSRNV